jgi:hypothetical protein
MNSNIYLNVIASLVITSRSLLIPASSVLLLELVELQETGTPRTRGLFCLIYVTADDHVDGLRPRL